MISMANRSAQKSGDRFSKQSCFFCRLYGLADYKAGLYVTPAVNAGFVY